MMTWRHGSRSICDDGYGVRPVVLRELLALSGGSE